MRTYEVTITRKLSNTFVVEARSGTEAAVAVGTLLAGPGSDPWAMSTEVEISRQMRAPSIVAGDAAPTLGLEDAPEPPA